MNVGDRVRAKTGTYSHRTGEVGLVLGDGLVIVDYTDLSANLSSEAFWPDELRPVRNRR